MEGAAAARHQIGMVRAITPESAFTPTMLAEYDVISLTGSPMHVYYETVEVDRQLDFMSKVFASGSPSFDSCAGLQIAVAAAGGKVRKMAQEMEAGIARRIHATAAGRTHPLLQGRPLSWDAPAIHGDEVEDLPSGATLLASDGATRVQVAEVRFRAGVFWEVEYYPELALGQVAAALRAQAHDLIEAGLALDEDQVHAPADDLDAFNWQPDNCALRWRIGVDGEMADERSRRREIINFLHHAPALRRCAKQHEPITTEGEITSPISTRYDRQRQPKSRSAAASSRLPR